VLQLVDFVIDAYGLYFSRLSNCLVCCLLELNIWCAWLELRSGNVEDLTVCLLCVSNRESLHEDEEFDQHQRQLAALLVSKVCVIC